ncbi:centromere protein F isoform X1 [Lepisosteus oculatus]|uniref:centromere protein F isoform X1 n=1 Tax=Lepisosteus oculatus TaxID=7918 RepID=UPI0035F51138
MSWAVEEWKDGLPGKALQKIQEIESQLDKLKKERQQKQFQLETLEAALQKQKQKMEVEKNEVTALKRENQSLVESCDNLEKTRQKVTHELQVKEQQVNYLEGQLAASKKQIEKLEQEIKRNKVELDRSQQSVAAGDQQSYGTPQKSFATPATPSQKLHDSKLEEIQEKYYKEVEERQKLEAELKVMQIKLLNQSSVSHKDIARQQTQSSIFPWQQDQTPSRQSHSFLETPLKRGIGASSFLWDHEETPYKRNSRSTLHDNAGSSQQSEQLKAMNQDLKAKVSEMELCLQAQDKDMKNHVNKLHEIQISFEKAKMELAEKDKNLNKCRDELTRVTGQYEQATSKCAALEQKLKQLSEELNCQRHNADSSRLALEQKMKDHEKEYQKELVHQQNSLRSLDQEFHQMKSKMSQELQLAKSDYNALQAEMDKIVQQKHHLEKCVEDLKQKLCRTEQILQTSQTKENEMRKNFEGIQKEKNSLSCQFEQSSRRMTQVEEELKAAKQNLKQSHSLMEDFKAKTLAQSEELKCLQVKMENQDQSSALELENMKKVVSDLEKIKEMAQNQIKKQEQDLEQMKSKQTVMEKEQQALQIALDSKQNECTELKKENDFLSKWKTEKEDLVNSVEIEREHMLNKIGDLEKNIEMIQNVSCGLNEKVNSLKSEKEDLTEQTDSLKGELLKKCMELEEKSKVYEELQKSSEEDNLKYTKDLENGNLQITELQAKASNLEMKLQLETCRADKMEQSYNEFILQYESACNLAKSKESVIDLKEEEILHLKNTISQALSQHEQQLEKLSTERCSLLKAHEESLYEKEQAFQQASLNFEKSQQEAALLKDQVSSLESSLKLQKNLNVELQSKCEELSKVKGELQIKFSQAEESQKELLQELSLLSEQASSSVSLQEQCNLFSEAAKEKEASLQNLTKELESKVTQLQVFKASVEELKNSVEETGLKSSRLEDENAQLKARLQTLEEEIGQVTVRSRSLEDSHNILCQEKDSLLKEISRLNDLVGEKEDASAEMIQSYKNELGVANELCAQLKSSLEDLQGKYTSVMELNSTLEICLREESYKKFSQDKELVELQKKYRDESEEHAAMLKGYEDKQMQLLQEKDALQSQLQNKSNEVENTMEKLEMAENEISQLKKNNVICNEELKKMQDCYRMITQEKETLKQQVSTHQSDLESLKSVLLISENCIVERNLKIEMLEAKLSAAELKQIEISDRLKEKEVQLNKINVQLEMLQMDLEDNQKNCVCEGSEFEQLKNSLGILEGKLKENELQKSSLQKTLHSAREELAEKEREALLTKAVLEDAQKSSKSMNESYIALAAKVEMLQATNEKAQFSLDEEVKRYTVLENSYSNLVAEKTELKTKLTESQHQCLNALEENKILIKNSSFSFEETLLRLQEENQTLKSMLDRQNDKSKCSEELKMQNKDLESCQISSECQYGSLSNLSKQQCFIDQLQAEKALLTQETIHKKLKADTSELQTCVHDDGPLCRTHNDLCPLEIELLKKSEELKMLSQTYEDSLKTLKEQMDRQKEVSKEEIEELKAALSRVQRELDQLQQHHLDEVRVWQQKLVDLNAEMETRLAEEKQNCEFLSSELETARLQMQCLDLSSRSLLCSENDEEFHQANTEKGGIKCLSPEKDPEELKTEILESTEQQYNPNVNEEVEHSVAGSNTAINDTFDGLLSGVEILTLENDSSVVEDDLHTTKTSTENLQVSVLQECLKDLEENNEKGNLENDVQTLCSQLDLNKVEIISKTDLFAEMEEKFQKLEKENSNLIQKLSVSVMENQKLDEHVRELDEELNSLNLQLKTSKLQLSDVTNLLESLEMAKGGWDEKLLQIESDLKRTQSEKANLEKHILSLEAEFEEIQQKNEKLQKELDLSKKAIESLEQQLKGAVDERNQLHQDLSLCTEEKEEVERDFQRWKGKAEQLEKDNVDAKEFIKILEKDITNQKCQRELANSSLDNLQSEKDKLLQQLQNMEQTVVLLKEENQELLRVLNEVKEEKTSVSTECEVLESKVQELGNENSKLSQLLESSLCEKGEIASKLNSTQEEVTQMRAGIEKLRVRIEADEKKKRHVGEQLKASQRKADVLVDKIEKLEREREMTEASLEDAILQAESAKAELEILAPEKKELTKSIECKVQEINDLKAVKEKLEKELLCKNEQVVQLQISSSAASERLEVLEKEVKVAKTNQENAAKTCESKVKEISNELQLSKDEVMSMQLKENDLNSQLSCFKNENIMLSQKLQEAEKTLADVKSLNQVLSQDCEAKQLKLIESTGVNDQLQQEVVDLQVLRQTAEEKLTSLKVEKEELEKEKVCLQTIVTEWEQRSQIMSTKAEVMQNTINSLEDDLKQHKHNLESVKVINLELTEKVSMLQENCFKLQNEINDCLKKAERMQKDFELERNSLSVELQSSRQEVESYKLSLEISASEKEELKKNLALSQDNIALYEQKIKEMEGACQEKLALAQERYEGEKQALKRELTGAEQKNIDCFTEINDLKSSKEELNLALKESEIKLEQCTKIKGDLNSTIMRLTKEKDSALNKLQLWMKSCKQLEQEKEALLKENQQQELLAKRNASLEEVGALQSEIQELKEALDEKSKEADESMEKYCNIMISLHKLEEANEILENKLALMSSQVLPLKGSKTAGSTPKTSDSPTEKNPKSAERRRASPRGQSRLSAKRQRASGAEEETDPAKAQEHLSSSKRVCGQVNPQTAQRTEEEDEEFRLEGLPEVVKKGFADIPSGEMSPYIIRRTTVQRCSPRLAAKRSPTLQTAQKGLENAVPGQKPTAEGSKNKKQMHKVESLPAPVVISAGKLLSTITNSPTKQGFESPVSNMEVRRSKRSLSSKKSPEQMEKRRQIVASENSSENCQVQ